MSNSNSFGIGGNEQCMPRMLQAIHWPRSIRPTALALAVAAIMALAAVQSGAHGRVTTRHVPAHSATYAVADGSVPNIYYHM